MYKHDIGTKAGTIWHLLANHGAMNIREIGEKTNSKESLILLALGWLARENKVVFYEKHTVLHFELSNSPISKKTIFPSNALLRENRR